MKNILNYTMTTGLILFLACCKGQPQKKPELLTLGKNAFVIENVSIVDGQSNSVQEGFDIVIDGDRISRVVKHGDFDYSDTTKRVNAVGKYIIPGLWDMHVNALIPGMMEWQHPQMLKYGVTGFRDCGGDPTVALELKKKKDSGMLAPDFVYAGPILDGPRSLNPTLSMTFKTPEEVAAKLDYIDQAGVDFYVTGGMLTKDTFDKIIQESIKRDRKVTVQGPFSYDYRYAAKSGIGSIETLSNWLVEASAATAVEQRKMFDLNYSRQDTVSNANPLALFAVKDKKERLLYPSDPSANLDYYSNEEASKLASDLASSNVYVCPQLLLIEDISMIDSLREETEFQNVPQPLQQLWVGPGLFGEIKFDEYDKERKKIGKMYFAKALDFVGKLHKAGIPILAGTHTVLPFVYPGSDLHKEMKLLKEAGLSNHEALMTATYNPAAYLDKLGDYGTIEKGKYADLIILNANPLLDIANTKKIYHVYKSGRLVQN